MQQDNQQQKDINLNKLEEAAFKIIWDDKDYQYKVNIPSYEGGLVVPIETVQPLIDSHKDLMEALEKITKSWIGENPFEKDFGQARTIAFDFESIVYSLGLLQGTHKIVEEWKTKNGTLIGELNWNPYVYNKDGSKFRYQREFVWNLNQKQNLIDSFYKGISCGSILIRKRNYGYLEKISAAGETELFFRDLVYGKQRLLALKEFLSDEFPDRQGNFYSDLSFRAQIEFSNSQLLTYCEMGEETTDEQTLKQFLKMNVEGVPQSKEHLSKISQQLGKI